MGFNMINGVFYATTYHPIQAGSIDGTDIAPHDNGVYRALLASSTGLYDPLGDPKAEGDPYCSLFVGRLSSQTDEKTLLEAMSRFGRVKGLRLVRHIVTGASRGYAFVEYETEKEMHQAYEGAYHMNVDNALIIVDYNRQQLMPGWIPRRLGGGLGGVKESGQLRFGGRDRPFRAPLKPIPHEELQKLGIPPPPEGRYMSRFQVPPPPMRKHDTLRGGHSGSRSKDLKHQGEHPKEENYTSAQDYNTSLKSHHGGESRKAGSREEDGFYRGDEDHEKRVQGGRNVKRRDDYSEHDRDMVEGLSKYEGFEFERERSELKTRREDIMQDRDAGHSGSRDREKRREVRDDKYHNEKRQRREVREHSSEKGSKGLQTEDYYEKANWKVEEYKEREFKQKNDDERRIRDRELDHSNGRGENKRSTEDYQERDIKHKNVDAEQRRGKDKELEHSKGRGDKERDSDEYERSHQKREEHKERDKKRNKVDSEQGNHESKRERRKDSREHAKEGGHKSHRHHESKNQKQEDVDQESLHGVERRTHRSHKKHHKHRERSRGASVEEEHERKKHKQH